jgi:O-glycosyl hydrolase
MVMQAADQTQFVAKFLGPAFRAANLKTKIIIYDHNADRTDYPISVLDDASAKQYIDGSAFHLYAGSIDALSKVHDAHPDRNLYFTEQWTQEVSSRYCSTFSSRSIFSLFLFLSLSLRLFQSREALATLGKLLKFAFGFNLLVA